jgi:hypothetical protein
VFKFFLEIRQNGEASYMIPSIWKDLKCHMPSGVQQFPGRSRRTDVYQNKNVEHEWLMEGNRDHITMISNDWEARNHCDNFTFPKRRKNLSLIPGP